MALRAEQNYKLVGSVFFYIFIIIYLYLFALQLNRMDKKSHDNKQQQSENLKKATRQFVFESAPGNYLTVCLWAFVFAGRLR